MKRSDIFDDSFRLFLVCSDPDVAPGCLTNVDSDGFVMDLRYLPRQKSIFSKINKKSHKQLL